MGSGVSLNYKGSSGFGTILGGCLSVIVTLFFTIFVSIQIFAWLFKPSFSQTFAVEYLPRKSNTTFTVPLKEFIPSFSVYNYDTDVETYDVWENN